MSCAKASVDMVCSAWIIKGLTFAKSMTVGIPSILLNVGAEDGDWSGFRID